MFGPAAMLFTPSGSNVMRRPISVLGVLLFGACAFSSKLRPAPGGPHLTPSPAVAVAPAGATPLGTVSVVGSSLRSGTSCEAQAVFEAKKVGATHVVVRPKKTPWYRAGQPMCESIAYFLPPR